MDHNKIGKYIAALRKEKNLTQQELGDQLFVTDKAVSKWERGLSLPDVTLLNRMAKILDVEVVDILNGEKGTTKKINVEEELENMKKEFHKNHQKKIRRTILFIIVLFFIIIYLIFRNASLGYKIENVHYDHANRNINLGIPKMSFMMKNNDRSYSFKNLRNPNIVENEIKKYLKTLKYSTCNDTIYYYDEKENFSIITYSVKNHVLYHTISYEVVENDYCFTQKINEYTKELNGARKFRTLHGEGFTLSEDKKFTPRLVVSFLDDLDPVNHKFTATLEVNYLSPIANEWKKVARKKLEKSTGTFEIKEDKLYYYRTDISEKSDDITIPEVSIFKIDNGNLILIENYLSDYEKNIILK